MRLIWIALGFAFWILVGLCIIRLPIELLIRIWFIIWFARLFYNMND